MIASDDEDVPVAVGQSSESESDAESPEPVAAAPLGSFGWEPLGAAVSPISAPESTPKKPVKLSEREVEAKERALAAGAAPASEAAFERALVARPQESLGWLQYAAWLLSLTEVAKARAVLRRGLKTMPVHLEAERSNLWLALLNLVWRRGVAADVICGGAAEDGREDGGSAHGGHLRGEETVGGGV